MNKNTQTLKYIISDILSASITWILFFFFRKVHIEAKYFGEIYLTIDNNFYLGITIIPIFWVLIYYISGYYHNIFRKSRLKELANTFKTSLLGVLIIFFKLILDDIITSHKDYYESILFLFIIQFILTYIPRLLLTSRTSKRIHNKTIGFPTLIVGSNTQIINVYNEIENMKRSPGNKFVGFVDIYNTENHKLEEHIPNLGKFEDLPEIINKNNIEEVIISIASDEHKQISEILSKLLLTNTRIKLIPSLYDIVSGYSRRLITIYKTPLIEIQTRNMSIAETNIKRIMDVILSSLACIVLIPVYISVAIAVKLGSKGPIFYRQERIGKNGKPFKIIKFRSMYTDAEKHGPALSSDNDSRITKVGKFMRKTRLDEIPQFFNVIIGEMSLVGPRPERQFFIDKIIPRTPFYRSLLKVKPGITSLGQVKYGYAENVDQMIERMKYDIIYLQNQSIYLDVKILILTVKTVFEASGK